MCRYCSPCTPVMIQSPGETMCPPSRVPIHRKSLTPIAAVRDSIVSRTGAGTSKEFYFITRNAGGNCEVLGITFDKLPKPHISQIVDGSNIIREEFAKIEKAAYDVLASDFRKKVDKLIPADKK